MNFGELYLKVIEKLGENSTSPQFWSSTELKDYINRGLKEFSKQTANKLVIRPVVQDIDLRFILPDDLMKVLAVYYGGKPLERRSPEYLESMYAGKAHYAGLRGDTDQFVSGDWRETRGDPTSWYFEEGKICLYPIPVEGPIERVVLTGTMEAYEGPYFLTLTSPLHQDLTTIDLFINDVLIDQATYPFEFNGPKELRFVDEDSHIGDAEAIGFPVSFIEQSGLAGDGSINLAVEVPQDKDAINVFINGTELGWADYDFAGGTRLTGNWSEGDTYRVESAGAFTRTSAVIESSSVAAAGQTDFPVPSGYPLGVNALNVLVDGDRLPPSDITEVDVHTVRIAACTGAEVITVQVIVDANQTKIRYQASPAVLSADADVPDLLPAFHDAAWQWACFEALAREGRSKDLEKASFYAQLFNRTVAEWKESFEEKAGPEAPNMPFMV